MSETFELDGKVYQYLDGDWYDAHYIRAPQAIAQQLDAQRRATGQGTVEQRRRKAETTSGGGSADSAFSHDDVFPFIAELIEKLYGEKGEFVTHREIVAELVEHPEVRAYMDEAIRQKGHTVRDWSNWMVQWFSAAFTEKRSVYWDKFERERIEERWAYRPIKLT